MNVFATRVLPLVIAGLAAAAAPAGAQPAGHGTASLHWLAGCWSQRSGGELVEEQWLAPRAGLLLGTSRTTRGDSLVGFEYMRIFTRSGALVFAAQPSGQPPVAFVARETGGREVMFENRTNDFPQRIRYRAAGADTLHARIEGEQGGAVQGVDFRFIRTVCAGPPAAARPGASQKGTP